MFTKDCAFCGKPFFKANKANTKRHKFCSRECCNKWQHSLHLHYCAHCGKEIPAQKSRQKYCSRHCFGQAHILPRRYFVCTICGKKFWRKTSITRAKTTKYCSRECSNIGMSGENNWHWQGGRTPYYGKNWPRQRRRTRKRDNYTCQKCGKTQQELGYKLDVHHIIPFRDFGIEKYREANKLRNLLSVCRTCHATIEPRRRKNSRWLFVS